MHNSVWQTYSQSFLYVTNLQIVDATTKIINNKQLIEITYVHTNRTDQENQMILFEMKIEFTTQKQWHGVFHEWLKQ